MGVFGKQCQPQVVSLRGRSQLNSISLLNLSMRPCSGFTNLSYLTYNCADHLYRMSTIDPVYYLVIIITNPSIYNILKSSLSRSVYEHILWDRIVPLQYPTSYIRGYQNFLCISVYERENKLRAYSHKKILVIYTILIFVSSTYIKL